VASVARASAGASRLSREEVIPGELWVEIFSHVLASEEGPVPCWTYVSDGLWKLGQKELVFTLKREPGEEEAAFPRELLGFYSTAHRLAAEEQIVDIGGFTEIADSSPVLLGRSDFRGVLYTPPQELEGISIDAPFLTSLIVTRDEMRLARDCGVLRVMSQLGRQYRFYPVPPWADRARRCLPVNALTTGSLLHKMPRARIPGGSLGLEQARGRLVLTLLPGALSILKEVLEDPQADHPMALITDLDPAADALLAWSPGQKQPEAISMPGATGARVAGSFLLIAGGHDHDEGQLFEDGFSLLFTEATFRRVKEAILGEKPASAEVSGHFKSFAVAYAPEGGAKNGAPARRTNGAA
jgi:hypothetical protein